MTALANRLLLPGLLTLLVACWLFGGVTVDDTWLDEGLQLLALPVLLVAAVVLLEQECSRWARIGILLVSAIALVPALQLLPLPESTWLHVPARAALAADLQMVGVTPAPHWSLSPMRTEASLWALLPAVAAFLAALALDAQQRRRLLQGVLVLAVFNVLFAFFQTGLPRDSALRLYTFNNQFGGLLANTNHQATACIIGMVLAVGLGAEARLRAKRSEVANQRAWWYFGAAAFLLFMVPLSTSRAGMSIVLPALVLALLLTRTLRLKRIMRSKRGLAAIGVLVVFAIVGLYAALGWMAVDQAEELRHTMALATLEIGTTQAPWGSGIGSFVPVFEQAIPRELLLSGFVNHAHNEYAQWWLTAGWLGMAVLVAVLAMLVAVLWALVKGKGRHVAIAGACLAAIFTVLAHSWAEYPLRTLALMCTMGAISGVMLGALSELRRHQPVTALKGALQKPAKALSLEEMDAAIARGATGQ